MKNAQTLRRERTRRNIHCYSCACVDCRPFARLSCRPYLDRSPKLLEPTFENLRMQQEACAAYEDDSHFLRRPSAFSHVSDRDREAEEIERKRRAKLSADASEERRQASMAKAKEAWRASAERRKEAHDRQRAQDAAAHLRQLIDEAHKKHSPYSASLYESMYAELVAKHGGVP